MIEQIIQSEPQRALEQLSDYDESNFSRPEERALYLLLLSMALDKNYIDLCSDSVVRYSVDYYSKTKDQYHKFLSYYYLGRIYENQGNNVEAINNYILSESYLDAEKYPDYYVRLCFAKGRIYISQFANDKAMEETVKALKYSKQLNNPFFYIRNRLDYITLQFGLADTGTIKNELDSLCIWMTDRGVTYPSQYYYTLIRYYLRYGSVDDEIVRAQNEYHNACLREGKKPNAFLQIDL